MPIQRGQIVLANLPFSDGSGSKVRPALVVQCDANNLRLRDLIVAVVSSNTSRATAEPTQLLIDITTPDGAATNLLHSSVMKCEHLITIEQSLIAKTIGRLPVSMMLQIDTCLKTSLAVT